MPDTQIFGYTTDNPLVGLPGFVAAHQLGDGGLRLTVRMRGDDASQQSCCDLPRAEALRLALTLLRDATAGFSPASPDAEPLLRWFGWEHLPERLQAVSAPFGALARALVNILPRCAERTVALRKLLEAKDCAVRAALEADDQTA